MQDRDLTSRCPAHPLRSLRQSLMNPKNWKWTPPPFTTISATAAHQKGDPGASSTYASLTKSCAISTELIRQASATITAPRTYPTEDTSPHTARAASPESTTIGRGGRRPAGDCGARFTPGYSHEKGEKTRDGRYEHTWALSACSEGERIVDTERCAEQGGT
jgi:hypothetical protein